MEIKVCPLNSLRPVQAMRNIQRDSTIRIRNRKAVVTEIEKEIDKLREIIEDKKAEKHSPIQADRDRYKMLKNRMTKLCRKRSKEKRRALLNNIKKDGKALHKPLSDKEKPQVGAIKQGNKLVTDKMLCSYQVKIHTDLSSLIGNTQCGNFRIFCHPDFT